jgi:pyrimidine-specific ribonucleoside hydrolase
MLKTLALLLTLCLAFALPVQGQNVRPVIIDTDMGSDDWMAILYTLNQPEIEVKAITVTGTGLAYCDAGVHLALGLVALADHADVPVTCGSETPLLGNNAFPSEWRTDMEAAEMLGLVESGTRVEEDAVSLFTSTIMDSTEPITVLALGPLTNVGAALEANPELAENIENIYIMGGAVDVEGSYVSDNNTTAEWNIYVDPHAARLTFESGAPITLVPLDATNEVPVTMAFFDTLGEQHDTSEAFFTYNMLFQNLESIESGGYFFWDPLAAAVMVDESLVTLETREVTVIDTEGAENGRTKPVGNGPEIRVATNPDAAAFEASFIRALTR